VENTLPRKTNEPAARAESALPGPYLDAAVRAGVQRSLGGNDRSPLACVSNDFLSGKFGEQDRDGENGEAGEQRQFEDSVLVHSVLLASRDVRTLAEAEF
jgi:hypothetical protein